nr:hypothetical protein BCU18_17785 [Vibrio lentus]
MIQNQFKITFTPYKGRPITEIDTRRLVCFGVPNEFDQSAVCSHRSQYMTEIFCHVDARHNAGKKTAFFNLKKYFVWCENNDYQNPMTGEAVSAYILHDKHHKVTGTVKSMFERLGIKYDASQTPIESMFNNKKPQSVKEGVMWAADGTHYIGINTRSAGFKTIDMSNDVSHLKDAGLLFTAIKALYDELSGDTLLAYISTIRNYAKTCSSHFFDAGNLANYISNLHKAVDAKAKGSSKSKPKARRLLKTFEAAEVSLPHAVSVAVNKLPSVSSVPVNGYDDVRYKKLVRLLFRLHGRAYQYIKSPSTSAYEYVGGNSNLRFSSRRAAINLLNTTAYYLIARYSAWTDTTLTNIRTSDVEFDNEHGEWVHLKAQKNRGIYKNLSMDLPSLNSSSPEELKIKKTGYRVIQNLLEVHELFDIPTDNLLFRVTKDNQSAFYAKNPCIVDFITGEIEGLKTLTTQRIRETEISLEHSKGGTVAAIKRSGSSPAVVMKNYSEGSPVEHKVSLGGVAAAIQSVALSIEDDVTASEVKDRLYKASLIPVLDVQSNTPMGTVCTKPTTVSAFSKKAERSNFGVLACSDLLACFDCPSAAIVDSIDDIWNFLSFKEKLLEGKIFSIDREHFANNFSEVIEKIDIIIGKFSEETLTLAREKLIDGGLHPYWDED